MAPSIATRCHSVTSCFSSVYNRRPQYAPIFRWIIDINLAMDVKYVFVGQISFIFVTWCAQAATNVDLPTSFHSIGMWGGTDGSYKSKGTYCIFKGRIHGLICPLGNIFTVDVTN